jgi:hypothetical protein
MTPIFGLRKQKITNQEVRIPSVILVAPSLSSLIQRNMSEKFESEEATQKANEVDKLRVFKSEEKY